MSEGNKKLILDAVDDLASGFLYYDRKDDEEMPVGFIESAIRIGAVSVDQIVKRFREQLEEGIKE